MPEDQVKYGVTLRATFKGFVIEVFKPNAEDAVKDFDQALVAAERYKAAVASAKERRNKN